MNCEICQRPASQECSDCGTLYCPDHGGEKCFRCAGKLVSPRSRVVELPPETAIYTTEKASRYSGKSYLQCYTKPGIRTVYVDDPGPPACHQCGGLARQICNNCHQLFCADHQGGKELCQTCASSSNLGIVILLATGFFLGLVMLLNLFAK